METHGQDGTSVTVHLDRIFLPISSDGRSGPGWNDRKNSSNDVWQWIPRRTPRLILHLLPNFASVTLFIRVQKTNRDLIKPVRLFNHRPSPANGAKMALLPLADPSATLFRAALRQRVVECIERHASGPKSRSIPDAAVFERHVSCATP